MLDTDGTTPTRLLEMLSDRVGAFKATRNRRQRVPPPRPTACRA